MSDDEEHSEPEAEETSEAELALKKRRAAQRQVSHGLDDAAKELLETNRKNREKMEEDIEELRRRNKQRKKERAELDKRLAAQRAAEEDRKKAAEEEKRKKKDDEEQKRQQARAQKQAEFEKRKDTGKRNFVISASSPTKKDAGEEAKEDEVPRKSKEQLDAEKKAILKQRIAPLGDVGSFDKGQLGDKAKELHKLISRLEGEKYDLEKRYKVQQVDLMELAERARQINKVGKTGLKRAAQSEEIDTIQARFAGAPAKIEMYSIYERQKDKRSYGERVEYHSGPRYLYPVERIKAERIVKWGEDGLPLYEAIGGGGESEGHGGHGE